MIYPLLTVQYRSPLVLCLFVLVFVFVFCLHRIACGILFPWPGMEPIPPAVEAWRPNHWTAREFPPLLLWYCFLFLPSFSFSQPICDFSLINWIHLYLEWFWYVRTNYCHLIVFLMVGSHLLFLFPSVSAYIYTLVVSHGGMLCLPVFLRFMNLLYIFAFGYHEGLYKTSPW